MAEVEGPYPHDPDDALAGKVRVLLADPGDGAGQTAAVPEDFYDIVNPLTFARVGAWWDLGLTTDALTFSHAIEGGSLEYQQLGEGAFEEVTSNARTAVLPIGSINKRTVAMVENSNNVEVVAASAGKPAHDIVRFGTISTLKTYRLAFVAYRPSGTSPVIAPAGVTFPDGSSQRLMMVATVLPLVTLALEESEEEYEAGSAVGRELTLRTLATPGLPLGAEHGFKHIERPGQIPAAV